MLKKLGKKGYKVAGDEARSTTEGQDGTRQTLGKSVSVGCQSLCRELGSRQSGRGVDKR